MALKLRELAALIGGELVGDGECLISRVAPIELAGPEEVAFVSNPKYTPFLQTTKAAAIIVAPQFRSLRRNLIVMGNPYLGFAKAVGALMAEKPPRVPGVHPTAVVAPTARLGEDVSIGPRVTIEDGAEIANGVTIMAGAFVGRARLHRRRDAHPSERDALLRRPHREALRHPRERGHRQRRVRLGAARHEEAHPPRTARHWAPRRRRMELAGDRHEMPLRADPAGRDHHPGDTLVSQVADGFHPPHRIGYLLV